MSKGLSLLVLLAWLSGGVSASCSWNQHNHVMECNLRTLDYKKNLTNIQTDDLDKAARLSLTCSDVFFFESQLRSDHFGSLYHLQHLDISYCKLRSLPPRSFVGLSSLETLSIATYNNDWSAILLDIDYEAFVGLDKLTQLNLDNNNIVSLPARMLCPLQRLKSVNLTRNQVADLEDLGLSNRTHGALCQASGDVNTYRGETGAAGGEQVNTPETLMPPVISLDLSHNEVAASAPGSLAVVAATLQVLLLNNNRLAVLDRTSFAGLRLLRVLDLSNNQLAALPPDLFSDNTELERLDLSNNSLSTVHLSVFGNLTKLAVLNLSRNHLDENWIKEDIFQDLGSLVELDLSHNNLANIHGHLLNNLRSLKNLALNNNRLHSLWPAPTMTLLPSLELLDLADNLLETIPTHVVSTSPQLSYLSLAHNKLQSIDKDVFKNLTLLRTLSVSHNLLTELPRADHLYGLSELDASFNILGVISRDDLAGLANLTRLSLAGNEISRVDPGAFDETPRLDILDLSHNRLPVLDQASISALVNLTRLDLSRNQLEDINGLLTMQRQLDYLNISSNRLAWFDYAFVPSSLRILDIHDNQIDSVENYYTLKEGFQLEYLDVSRNKIRALGVLSLLPSLKTILLRDNRISDIGHNTFLNKDKLKLVDLRGNRLTIISIASISISQEILHDRPQFLLSENPFHCSCEMQWLVTPGSSDRLPILMDLEDAECLVHYHGNDTAIVAKMTTVPPNQYLCAYDSHCFSLCMCCDFFGCDCRMQCPDGCSCYHDSTWSSNIVQCSGRGHGDVPPLIPMDATTVFLDGNNLHDLSGQIFLGRSRMKSLYLNSSNVANVSNNTFLGLLDLQLLDLSHNRLQNLKGQEFNDLVNLRELYLHANGIMHIAESTFRSLKSLSVLRLDQNLLTSFPIWELASNPFLLGVYVAQNLWTCDCSYVSKFKMFIDGNLDKVLDARETKCVDSSAASNNVATVMADLSAGGTSGRNGCIDKTGAEYQALNGENAHALPIIIGCCVILLAILFTIFAAYKMQDTLKLWIHAKYGLRLQTASKGRIINNNSDKIFDAYVVYCEKDEPSAFAMLSELPKHRLCLHHKDMTSCMLAGNRSTREVMVATARASARVVVILSRAFLVSEWDGFKTVLHTIQNEGPSADKKNELSSTNGQIAPELGRNFIIVLAEDMIDFEKLASHEVKNFVHSCASVLKWPESKFWTKLRFALPDPVRGSPSAGDKKTQTTSLFDPLQAANNPDVWPAYSLKDILQQQTDSGVSSAHMSTVSLNQGLTGKPDSLRHKNKSRQSIPSTVESNNEFIYLTPKPKKAKCQQPDRRSNGNLTAAHLRQQSQEIEPPVSHQRSSSDAYQQHMIQQQQMLAAANLHQRSKSGLASVPSLHVQSTPHSPTTLLLHSNQSLLQTIQPANFTGACSPSNYEANSQITQTSMLSNGLDETPGVYDAKNIYGSTSFIYKLISSNDAPKPVHASPQQQQNIFLPHQQPRGAVNHGNNVSSYIHQSPTQHLLHQRSKSTLASSPLLVTSTPIQPEGYHSQQHSRSISQLTGGQYHQPEPANRPPHQSQFHQPTVTGSHVKLSRSSSQLSGSRGNALSGGSAGASRSVATLAGTSHRRDPSFPTRLQSPWQQQPPMPGTPSTASTSSSPSIQSAQHQRSKSTPYSNGFVV